MVKSLVQYAIINNDLFFLLSVNLKISKIKIISELNNLINSIHGIV